MYVATRINEIYNIYEYNAYLLIYNLFIYYVYLNSYNLYLFL